MNKSLIEKHRYVNVEGNWYDSVYEQFGYDMEDVGIHVEEIHFTGFSSQGDGACFEGKVMNWERFLRSLGYDNEWLILHARKHCTFNVKHSGRYYHENCTRFNWDLPLPENCDEFLKWHGFDEEEDGLRNQMLLAVLEQYDSADLEVEFKEAFKSHMRDLYKKLELDYDYYTSDEAVWETLVANEMTEEEEID